MIRVSSEADKISVAKANEAGQGHVFQWWDDLSPEQQATLISQVGSIDFQTIQDINHERSHGTTEDLERLVLKPAEVTLLPGRDGNGAAWKECREAGEEALSTGKTALVMVSGGSPLGSLGDPTGFLPVGPVTGKSVFRLHAEKVRALNRRHRVSLRWWVVTHPDAHERICEHFKEENYFGLNRADLVLSPQPLLPLIDRRGKFVLAENGRLAMEPNGHGGVLLDFLRKERLEELESRGIEYIFFFLVDNPLVKIADPVFLGYHILSDAEVTSKSVPKTDAEEEVGVFCQLGGATGVIEYSELSKEDRELEQEDGRLAFRHGNMAVHVFSVVFFRRMLEERVRLPFHARRRKVAYIDRRGRKVRPTEPNCNQFCCFAFDALRVAQRSRIVEVRREEEFSPIKSEGGKKSPQTAQRDLSRLWASWLSRAGATFEGGDAEEPPYAVEISPLWALDETETRAKIELPLHIDGNFCLGGTS